MKKTFNNSIIALAAFAACLLASVSALSSVEQGDAYIKAGNYEKGIREYETAFKEAPTDQELLVKITRACDDYKWFGRSAQYWDEYLRKYPKGLHSEEAKVSGARAHRWVGSAFFDNGEKLELVITHLETAVKLDPKLFEAWYWLGRVQMQKGDCAEAVKSLDSAAALNPKDEKAAWLHKEATGCNNHGSAAYNYYVSAFSLYEKKDLQGALSLYQKASEANPKFADAFYWLARIHNELGENDKALIEWQKVLSINPADMRAQWFLEKTKQSLKAK